MVQDAVDHHPLGLDAIAVEALLHLGILGILVLPLLPLAVLIPRAVVEGWRLIHVVLALVVAVHDGVVELQLQQREPRSARGQRRRGPGRGSKNATRAHLQLLDPGAVPVGQTCPLHEEFTLWDPLQHLGWGERQLRVRGGQRGRQRGRGRLLPGPVQDALDFALQWRALGIQR